MEEKERYKLESYNEAFCQIHDTESDEWYLRKDLVKDLLNQQDQKIKELKQQLHDLPKKIVEYFYDEIRHRAILEDDYCPDHNLERKYGVRKCLLENIRTTILKKYGGEDESNND